MNLEKLFHLKEHRTDVKTEVMAGITTFMTMAYILAVNPNILSAAGMDRGAVFTATALSSFIATCLMALLQSKYRKYVLVVFTNSEIYPLFQNLLQHFLYSLYRGNLKLLLHLVCHIIQVVHILIWNEYMFYTGPLGCHQFLRQTADGHNPST